MGGNFLARVRTPARLRAGSNGFGVPDRYVPATFDEILSLQQCASWLQQPEPVLRELIGNGTLKPLPLPGADYRLHARSVLLQMGSEALWNSPSSAGATAIASSTDPRQNRHPRAHTCLMSRPGPEGQVEAELPRPSSPDDEYHRPHAVPKVKSEPKEKVVRRCYRSYGQKIEVTYRLGDSARHRLSESNLLDLVVTSLKPGRN